LSPLTEGFRIRRGVGARRVLSALKKHADFFRAANFAAAREFPLVRFRGGCAKLRSNLRVSDQSIRSPTPPRAAPIEFQLSWNLSASRKGQPAMTSLIRGCLLCAWAMAA